MASQPRLATVAMKPAARRVGEGDLVKITGGIPIQLPVLDTPSFAGWWGAGRRPARVSLGRYTGLVAIG